jgi:ubiquinone/menaquinone biosynthesis C-methylase UbiE
MRTSEEAKARAARTYNSASDHYDDPANSFWQRFGRRTIERLNLPAGARVLDVCCGSGASAIPAAEAVGPSGRVLGIDLAENLLALARAKAQNQGLSHAEFRSGDMLDLRLPETSFDAVICVFGIFFVPEVEMATGELWRRVAPGGKLAITTWGPRFSEPLNTVFWDSVRDLRPDLYKGFNPWDRLIEADSVRELFASCGARDIEVVAEHGTHPLRSPEDWWSVVLGSGYRATIEQLDADSLEEVRRKNFDYVRESQVKEVETNVIYGTARREIKAPDTRGI